MSVTIESVRVGPHLVHFYEDDDELALLVSDYLAAGLRCGEAAIVVATAEHARAVERLLAGAGVAAGRGAGRLFVLDALTTLALFEADGHIDPVSFDSVVGGAIRRAADGGRRAVRVFGEMVGVLWAAGRLPTAMELEGRWNELGWRVPFSLLCGYRSASVDDARTAQGLCRVHSSVVGALPGGAGSSAADRREETLAFAGGVMAVRRARWFVTDVLARWGHPELVDDAALVAGELAANAVVHAGSPFTITVADDGDGVTLSVRDGSRRVPAVKESTPDATGGRGLWLVAAHAAEWGTLLRDDGKVVWARLDVPSTPAERAASDAG